MNENEIAEIVVDCAYKLHVETGPGLFESVYECILADMLETKKLDVKRQVSMPTEIRGIQIRNAFVADLVINDKVIIELKSKSQLSDADMKQLLTYLKLTGYKLGLLINFGEALIKNGIKRMINGQI
jgi:GxxExxY protein